jgi:hypothetical protein
MYFIYDTEQEAKNIDAIICKGENIGQHENDITKYYADIIQLDNGTFAYICDEITTKYITDRQPIEL